MRLRQANCLGLAGQSAYPTWWISGQWKILPQQKIWPMARIWEPTSTDVHTHTSLYACKHVRLYTYEHVGTGIHPCKQDKFIWFTISVYLGTCSISMYPELYKKFLRQRRPWIEKKNVSEGWSMKSWIKGYSENLWRIENIGCRMLVEAHTQLHFSLSFLPHKSLDNVTLWPWGLTLHSKYTWNTFC